MNEYRAITSELFSSYLLTLRKKLDLTQEQMAEYLRITSRAYRELESGRHSCSGTTLLFFMLLIEKNGLNELLEDFRHKVTEFEENDIA